MVGGDAHARSALPDADAAAGEGRREALHAGVTDLDRELDVLEAQPEPDVERFQAALRQLLATLHRHIEEADAPDGLLAQVVEAASWFATRAEQLRGEHGDLLDRTQALIAGAGADEDVRPLLVQARDLSSAITQHRHRGTKLLLDAYMLDVTAGD